MDHHRQVITAIADIVGDDSRPIKCHAGREKSHTGAIPLHNQCMLSSRFVRDIDCT